MTANRPVTLERFAWLWDGIVASLETGGVFRECLVTDPTRLINPNDHHVFVTAQFGQGRLRHSTFMVPIDEADPAFVAWLAVLIATRRLAPVAPICTITKLPVDGGPHRVRALVPAGQGASRLVGSRSPDATPVVETLR